MDQDLSNTLHTGSINFENKTNRLLFIACHMGNPKNCLKQGEFCNEFNDYLEKLSCMNGNIVILGDFNTDWLNTNGSERKRFVIF